MKEIIFKNIDENKELLIELSDFIFDNPELGLEEFKSSEKIIEILKKIGFEVERSIGGLETGFRAVYRVGEESCGPSFGLLCEYDALEGMGHGCGHHMQPSSVLGAAIGLINTIKDKNFKIVIYHKEVFE